MSSLEKLISEFEDTSEVGTSELTNIINHSKLHGSSELERRSDELNELIRLHQLITEVSKKVYTADDPDFISALDHIHRIEKKRESISDDIIDFLSDLAEYAKSNQGGKASYMLNEESVRDVIDREKRAQKIESKIESQLLKAFRSRALEQASDIIENDRPHVKFEEEALQSLAEFAYSETYKDPVLEAYGAVRFEEIERKGGRNNDYVVEEFIPCKNYRDRERDSVKPSMDFVDEIEDNNNLVSFHTHPPGAQKSHSQRDSVSSYFSVLAIPESRNKIWVYAQYYPTGGEQKNLAIQVIDGKVPQAHLGKYNRAIKKCLATKKMKRDLKNEYGNWDQLSDEFGPVSKWMKDHKLHESVNQGGEKQWLRFVRGEEY